MRVLKMKRGDQKPNLLATLKSRTGVIDLTGSEEVRLYLRRAGSEVVSIDQPVSVVDAPNGVVEYAWQAGDTDIAGSFEAEFEIQWIDGKETVPNDDDEPMVVVRIAEDIK